MNSVQIATEYWSKEDYLELESILSTELDVKKSEYARWSAESLEPALFASFVSLSGPLIDSVVNFLLSKIFEKFAKKLTEKMSQKKYPHLALSFSNPTNGLILQLTSTDEQTIQKALDTVKDALKTPNNKKEYYFYNNETNCWDRLIDKPIDEEIIGVIAGTRPFEKDGQKITLHKKELEKIIQEQIGMPVLLNHHGKIVGVVLDAWIEDDEEFKVAKNKVGIFTNVSAKDRDDIKKCKGMSLAGSRSKQ